MAQNFQLSNFANFIAANGASNTVTIANNLIVNSSAITANAVITDNKGDIRDIPVITQSAVYQIAATDNGRVISTTANVTVNGTILTIGEAVSVYNNTSANITIISGSGATMYLGGTATTGNRTLAQRGLATVLMVASNTFVISGAGLT